MDVTALPFNRLLGLEAASAESGFLVSLPGHPQYTNHLGTVHAGALLAVAEAASGAFLVREVGEIEGVLAVVRRLDSRFRKPARGRVSGRASVDGVQLTAALADLQAKGRALVTVTAEVVDEGGAV